MDSDNNAQRYHPWVVAQLVTPEKPQKIWARRIYNSATPYGQAEQQVMWALFRGQENSAYARGPIWRQLFRGHCDPVKLDWALSPMYSI